MAKRKGDIEPQPEPKRRRAAGPELDELPSLSEAGLTRCFRTVTASLYVAIAPAFQSDPLSGVRAQHLDPMVLVHSERLGGVVVGYDQLELLGPEDESSGKLEPGAAAGLVINDSPFGFSWIRARFILWEAKHGDTLEGYISLQSAGQVSLLVHDAFTATISREYLPSSWHFEQVDDDDESSGHSGGYWQDEQGNRVMGRLKFTVRSVKASARLVHIRGSLIENEIPSLPSLKDNSKDNKHKTFDDEPEAEVEAEQEQQESEFEDEDEKPKAQKSSNDESGEAEAHSDSDSGESVYGA